MEGGAPATLGGGGISGKNKIGTIGSSALEHLRVSRSDDAIKNHFGHEGWRPSKKVPHQPGSGCEQYQEDYNNDPAAVVLPTLTSSRIPDQIHLFANPFGSQSVADFSQFIPQKRGRPFFEEIEPLCPLFCICNEAERKQRPAGNQNQTGVPL